MATDVLQKFLTRRLFDVGSDDAKVAPLRAAAEDIAALIKVAPQRTAAMTLVAIDSAIGPDEPLVVEVMGVLEKRWQSYAGAFTDERLPTVARAILLQALAKAMGSEPIAAAVSLTARSSLPLLGDVADRELWTEIISDADRRLARRAEREWAMPSSAHVAGSAPDLPEAAPLAAPQMNRDWLVARLEAASGPHNAAGEAQKTPVNPHFPNAGQPWTTEFAAIAATAISNAVNSVTKEMAERIVARDAGQSVGAVMAGFVDAAAGNFTATAIGLERRTGLLWWKQALFSPAAGVSYRGLDPAAAAATAALDASRQTGAFAPRMAEALVGETLRSIATEAMTKPRRLTELVAAAAASGGSVRAALEEGFGAIHREPGRAPLGATLLDADAEAAAERLGLRADTELTPIEFGVWLFRDLQASAATPPPVKRRKGTAAA